MSASRPNTASLIITAYNGAPWIERTLDSGLSQTHPFDEIIVVDDGSTDETTTLVVRRASQNPRIRLISQHNQGTAAAVSSGLEAAQGDVICLLSQDCYAEPDWLARALDAFDADPRLGIARGPIRSTRSIDVPFFHCTVVDHDSLAFEAACIAYLARAVDEAGRYFDRDLSRHGDDADMAWRILERGYRHVWLQDPVARHEVVPRDFWTRPRSTLEVHRIALLLKKHPMIRRRLRLGFLWGGRYRYLKTIGFHACLLGLLTGLPRFSGLGSLITLGAMLLDATSGSRNLRVSPFHRWLTIPLHKLLTDLLGTYVYLYGSIRFGSPVI